ncbi:MAG TPA: oligosaccharide flippase family protein, partial [Niabella sp.]|nr:oligosaccharide flippase family protein [Niabella sp.]
MSAKIRRQSIVSSLVVYCGFLVGLVNVFLFTRNGAFSPEQYGLYNMFIAAGIFLSSLGSLAMPSYLHKFFPFYQSNLDPEDNDQLSWALLIGLLGCVLVAIGGWLFKGLVIQKFGSSSALFVTYYKWLFPFVFGLILYGILEAYGWVLHKSVLTTFIREVEWRLLITVILILFSLGFIKSFDTFVILYSFTYLILFVTLLVYLFYRKRIHFSFRVSRVTKKFFKKIATFCLFIFSASVVSSLSGIFDTIVIASVMPDGLESAAIFSLAQLMASIVQAPQRGIIAASIPHLSLAWKSKNLNSILTIYKRSSINLLLAATILFVLIFLNYKHAVSTFDLQKEYMLGFIPFIFLGLTRIIDLGTGVNREIIGTSNFWRFELISNIILLLFMLPLSYILTKQFGIIGPSIAGLVSTFVYNLVRIIFLWRKFKLFPFTIKSVYVVS